METEILKILSGSINFNVLSYATFALAEPGKVSANRKEGPRNREKWPNMDSSEFSGVTNRETVKNMEVLVTGSIGEYTLTVERSGKY